MTIFLTGFPGFIAGRLVEKLANQETRFFLLVQPNFAARAAREIETIAAKTGTPLENFHLFSGDITQKKFGLAASDLTTLQTETTDVFHLAAVYDLRVARDLAMRVN